MAESLCFSWSAPTAVVTAPLVQLRVPISKCGIMLLELLKTPEDAACPTDCVLMVFLTMGLPCFLSQILSPLILKFCESSCMRLGIASSGDGPHVQPAVQAITVVET